MRWRDLIFIVVLVSIAWWAIPHVKEDLARGIVPDSVERLFPRLVDRLTRRRTELTPAQLERCMESQMEVSRLANADPVPAAAAAGTAPIDHGYGW